MIVGAGRTRVKLELIFQGEDLVLLLTGGRAHVGAVAVRDGRRGGDPPRVMELPHHREGSLAGTCADIVAEATGRTVVTVAGIHQDEATRVEIEAIVANAEAAAKIAAEEFNRAAGTSDERT